MTSLSEDSYRPPTRDQHSGDKAFVQMLNHRGSRLSAFPEGRDHGSRMLTLAEEMSELDAFGMTVFDRKRQLQRGIPAVSYTPTAGQQPTRCPKCDGTGWLDADSSVACTKDGCEARKRVSEQMEEATQDLVRLERNYDLLRHLSTVLIVGLSEGHPYNDTLEIPLRRVEDSVHATPPAHIGPDEAQQRELAKLNMAEDPLCRSCARVKDHRGMPHLSVPVEGMDICRWCVRHLDETEDQRNARKLRGESIHEGIWPPLEHVKAHAEGRHVRQKQPGHVERKAG